MTEKIDAVIIIYKCSLDMLLITLLSIVFNSTVIVIMKLTSNSIRMLLVSSRATSGVSRSSDGLNCDVDLTAVSSRWTSAFIVVLVQSGKKYQQIPFGFSKQ